MADTVSTQTLTDTTGVKFAVKMTNFSDGTGAVSYTHLTLPTNREV